MKPFDRSPRRRTTRTDPGRRTRWLAAFDRSGLSAAAFARQHGLNYTTFCGWRQRRSQSRPLPGFVQVQLPSPAAAVELLIELGATARLRVNSASQIELAARLLQSFNADASC